MSNARTGVGAQFQRGDGGSPEVFSKIAEVKSIKGPSRKRGTIDVSNTDSTGGYTEVIPGMKEGGQIQIDANFVPTDNTYQLIESDFENLIAPRNFRVLCPDGTKYTFGAFITGLSMTFETKSAMGVSITADITGPVVRS